MEHRRIYKVSCRNLTLAVWNKTAKTFTGIREKWGSRYLDSEFPYVDGGTVRNWSETAYSVPEDIPLDVFLGTECSDCKQPVDFSEVAKWRHLKEDSSHPARPMTISNVKLFDFIQQTEVELEREQTD